MILTVLGVSSDVWLPILSLVLGYAFALLTEAFRDGRQRQREEAARTADRQAAREAKREELEQRHREFQRQTLLKLQEALHDLGRVYGEEHHADVMHGRKQGSWRPRAILGEELNLRAAATERRVNILASRVDDEGVRALAARMREAGSRLTFANSEDESFALLQSSIEPFGPLNDRIGEILRRLH